MSDKAPFEVIELSNEHRRQLDVWHQWQLEFWKYATSTVGISEDEMGKPAPRTNSCDSLKITGPIHKY